MPLPLPPPSGRTCGDLVMENLGPALDFVDNAIGSTQREYAMATIM